MARDDLQRAWDKFYSSGKVVDYLAVCAVKDKNSFFAENTSEGKNSHRRTGHKGASHG